MAPRSAIFKFEWQIHATRHSEKGRILGGGDDGDDGDDDDGDNKNQEMLNYGCPLKSCFTPSPSSLALLKFPHSSWRG